MNISFEKIGDQLERDIAQLARNQVLIDRMQTVTKKDKFMISLPRFNWLLLAGLVFCFLFWIVALHAAFADDLPKLQCPTAGEPCKVLYLTGQEEKLLMGQNGVLDTAAQARSLDLGQFAVYFKTRIAGAVQGEVKPVPPSQTNNVSQPSDKPLDK